MMNTHEHDGNVLSIQTQNYNVLEQNIGRISAGVWGLVALFFISFYSSNLRAFLMRPVSTEHPIAGSHHISINSKILNFP